ncbi:hypothetical protein NLA06_09125 [Desulfomicrobium sp. ZS1]|uniref:hypothetical protein n=1 Tax=Desulfomicrobium sp. ZS1 TaxID=2952228 RepID=UPI0020B2485E|nr:hypothetical protein [Desulfomicrobium sp. ZS1]UTF48752.1 hypothetical protein NLA06_09125 [Desulfomicrobium sp. ZS1]
MLSIEQQRVYEWLNDDLNLPVFAAAYKGSVILLKQKNEGYVSFVAHTGRDIMNRLASTVCSMKSEQVQYKQHIDKIQSEWLDEWSSSDKISSDDINNGHLIPVKICKIISKLIDEHKSGRIRSSEADGLFFSTFLDYSDKDKIPRNFLSEWKEAKEWFLSHAHLREAPFRGEIDAELIRHFKCLDSYLRIAAHSQYNRLRELDEILDATNL